MNKIYARQIDPAIQLSPVMQESDWNGTWLEDLIVDGNSSFISHMTESYESWIKYKDRLYEWASEINFETEQEKLSLFCMLESCVPKNNGSLYTEEELKQWYALLTDKCPDVRKVNCRALTLMTGKEYAVTTVTGSTQSDWNFLYYPVNEWNLDAIREFEVEYYNLGSEWLVNNSNEGKDSFGYSVYIHEDWSDQKIRESLSEHIGCSTEELIIYKIDHYVKTPVYQQI